MHPRCIASNLHRSHFEKRTVNLERMGCTVTETRLICSIRPEDRTNFTLVHRSSPDEVNLKKHIDDVRMHLDPIYFLILASDSISLTSSSGISNTANTAPVIQSPDILSVSYVAKSLREDTAFE